MGFGSLISNAKEASALNRLIGGSVSSGSSSGVSGSGRELTIAQAEKWMQSLQNPGKYGWVNENKKIGSYLIKRATSRGGWLRNHMGPDGRPWQKKYSPPLPKIGDRAPMMVGAAGGSTRIITQNVASKRGVRAAMRMRRKYGPPLKELPALVRTSGKFKTKTILDHLRSRGRSVQAGKNYLRYGFTPGTRWIEKLQYGGTYKGGRVPPREVLGLANVDLQVIDKIYAEGFQKRVARGLS